MKTAWHLNPKEIAWATSHYYSDSEPFDLIIKADPPHADKPTGAQGRNKTQTNECLVMTHIPTDEKVHGKYTGYYTRSEKSQMRQQLLNQLFLLLEKQVAKKMAIPRRPT